MSDGLSYIFRIQKNTSSLTSEQASWSKPGMMQIRKSAYSDLSTFEVVSEDRRPLKNLLIVSHLDIQYDMKSPSKLSNHDLCNDSGFGPAFDLLYNTVKNKFTIVETFWMTQGSHETKSYSNVQFYVTSCWKSN